MRDQRTEARLQVTSAVGLLNHSRLVRWDEKRTAFVANKRDPFEAAWPSVYPNFGRLICWMTFSAGAEFLAKGVCVDRGIEVRTAGKKVPQLPKGDLNEWALAFLKAKKKGTSLDLLDVVDFGSLSALCRKGGKLEKLCTVANANREQRVLLLAGYDLLRSTIRNRDLHAYVPNVRDDHFGLVPDLFARCFNHLASFIDGGANVINEWHVGLKEWIGTLPPDPQ